MTIAMWQPPKKERAAAKRKAEREADAAEFRASVGNVKAILANAMRGGFGLGTNDTASVYVMEAGERAVKVGVSKSVGQRVAGIQTGQQENTTVYWAVTLDRKEAFAVEKLAHAELTRRGLRARGEWFWASPDDAVRCVLSCIKRSGFKSSPHLCYGLHRSPEV